MQKPKTNQFIWFLAIILILGLILILSLVFLSPKEKKAKSPFPMLQAKPKEFSQNEEFNQFVTQLETPKKLVDYLNKNFIIESREKENPLSPKEFFERKKGNSWDFAVFVSYVLWRNKFEASIIRYKYGEEKINAVVVFRDTDLPKTIIFTEEGVKIYPHGWSFEEMFQKEEERLGSKIKEYAISYWTDKGELWPEEWRER